MTAPHILVTGATGFIGREIVRRLWAAGRPVLVMARARADLGATARVAAALGADPAGAIDIIEGDLARPGCGLAAAAWCRLRETIETVIHCAGDPAFVPDAPATFRAGHVEGPRELLERLGAGRLRHWAQLSTAYVCGRRSGIVLESEHDVGQTFHNPYEQVKLEAELVLRATARRLGVDLRVFRPSIVVGAAPGTTGGAPSNLFFDFLRLAASLASVAGGTETRLRIEAAPSAPFNIVPVEYVATAIVALADDPGAAGRTLHLAVKDAPTQETMLALISARLGVRGLILADGHREPLRDPTPLERALGRALAPYRDYLLQPVRFDDTVARGCLAQLGIASPTLDAPDVARLIDQALTTPAARPGMESARAGR
ncbi:MAG TPA: SDR family oxidoreductase [Methylomirabilota bacterium]|nr:SDR family oxidoreductase [Methylomirabilota bacterium]